MKTAQRWPEKPEQERVGRKVCLKLQASTQIALRHMLGFRSLMPKFRLPAIVGSGGCVIYSYVLHFQVQDHDVAGEM